MITMSKKSKKVEKETRRLMEAIGELVKKKNDSLLNAKKVETNNIY